MKKQLSLCIFIILALCMCVCSAYSQEGPMLNETFEDSFSFSVVKNENSSVEVKNIYGFDGSSTRAVNLSGTGAYFDIIENVDMTDTAVEFDFLPQNLTEHGFVFMSLVSEDSLKSIALTEIADEGLSFLGECIKESLHIDWYRIKILITAKGLQIFVNNEKKSEVIPFPSDFDIKSSGVRFEVSGANGNNSIYIDNVLFSQIKDEGFSVSYCPFERYNCEIEKILPGQIKLGITVFNHEQDRKTASIRLSAGLYRNGKLYDIISLPMVLVEAGESTTITEILNVPSDNGNYEIKVFGWNDKIQPYITFDILK